MRRAWLGAALLLCLGGCHGAYMRRASAPLPSVAGDWEVRCTLPPPALERMVVHLEQASDRNTLIGALVQPTSRAFVTGRLQGRLMTLGIGPVSGLSYSFDLVVSPQGERASGSVRAEGAGPALAGVATLVRLP